MTTITVHSFKGGTGKSLVAASLAYLFSKNDEKTLLIDGDYSSPCLSSYFPLKKESKMFTDFLKGKLSFKEAINNTKFKNLYISYAPSPRLSEEVLTADKATHGWYLKRIMEGIEQAHENLDYDKIIFDNSSGVSIPAINQLACSNQSIIVIKPVQYGIESTYDLGQYIYKKLAHLQYGSHRKDYFLWNQIPQSSVNSQEKKIEEYLDYWTKKFSSANFIPGPRIYYSPEIISSMIGNDPIDLDYIYQILRRSIEELVKILRLG